MLIHYTVKLDPADAHAIDKTAKRLGLSGDLVVELLVANALTNEGLASLEEDLGLEDLVDTSAPKR